MADSGNADRPARERSRGRSETRRAPETRPGGGSSSQQRLSNLENQVSHLASTLSGLGPLLEQLLSVQQSASSNQSQIPQTQAPITPNVVGTPTAPNAVPVNVPPFPAGADSTFAQTNHPNIDIPNHPMNPWPSQPNQGISSGSGMQDPLANDPWRQFYQSSSQAAGVPDQPFPHSLANSPDQQHPFAQQGLGTVIPPPPGFSPVQPIQVNTPQGSAHDQGEQKDDNPFRRSEKWMPPVPTPALQDWKTRPTEIVGFIEWVTSLASWTGLGSNAYPTEIMAALKEREPLGWHRLTSTQVTRSVRLMSILKLCFENSAKASLVIRNYEEAKGFQRCCGFECLRLLAKEYAIKTRTELLFFRSQLSNASITSKTIPECVRKVQSELYQFERVSQLVDPNVNTQGLEFQEADKVLLLLRSLPAQCRQWIVLHSSDERFDTYLQAALRYESQQRIWSDLNSQPIAAIKGDKGKKGGKGKDKKGEKGAKGFENRDKGKGVGGTSETRTCFSCNQRGHLACRRHQEIGL